MKNKDAVAILKESPYFWDRTNEKEKEALSLGIKALEEIDNPRFIIRAKDKKSAQEFSEQFRKAWEANQAGLILPADVAVIPLTPPDSFTREELEAWLWRIAENNTDNNGGEVCKEIIDRLDGFERFCKDRREGKV